MSNEYEKLEQIFKELDYVDKAKKYAFNLKVNNSYIDDNRIDDFIGKKFNMLTILEKTDKRAKNRLYII